MGDWQGWHRRFATACFSIIPLADGNGDRPHFRVGLSQTDRVSAFLQVL